MTQRLTIALLTLLAIWLFAGVGSVSAHEKECLIHGEEVDGDGVYHIEKENCDSSGGTSSGGLPWLWILWFSLTVVLVGAVAVDSGRRSASFWWVVLTFFTGIFGAVIYLIFRPEEVDTDGNAGYHRDREEITEPSHCCPNCGELYFKEISSTVDYCSNCGKTNVGSILFYSEIGFLGRSLVINSDGRMKIRSEESGVS